MPTLRSLEQERAKAAWDAINEVKEANKRLEENKQYEQEYASLARSAVSDVQASGLGQTLAFWRAKGFEKGKPKPNNAYAVLFNQVAHQLQARKILPSTQDPVVWISNDASIEEYRRATSEAIAFLIWLKRFAEAELL